MAYFYAYSTQANWQADNLGGPFTTPILRSRNLVNWQFVGDALKQKPSWKSEGGHLGPGRVAFWQYVPDVLFVFNLGRSQPWYRGWQLRQYRAALLPTTGNCFSAKTLG
jgi:hypothetical protein